MKNGTQPGANGNAIEQLPQTQNNRENDQTPSNSSFTNNSYLYNSDHNGIRFQTVGSAYQVVFEKTQYANIITDAKGKILDVNSAALKMFGYSIEEITSIKSSYLFDITEEDYERCLNERNLKGNVTIEKLGRTKDGKKFPCEISSDTFTTNQGEERAICNIIDISQHVNNQNDLNMEQLLSTLENEIKEKLKGERLLAENNERIKLILNSSSEVYTILIW